MDVTLENLGFRLCYDADGKYPIDTTKPIELPANKTSFTCYVAGGKPMQQEDGSWIRYKLISTERSGSECKQFRVGMLPSFVVVVGKKKDLTSNNTITKIFIEEMFYFEKMINDEYINEWVKDDKIMIGDDNSVIDYNTSVASKIKFHFIPNGIKLLRYEDAYDNSYYFKNMPQYIDGKKLKMINLINNEFNFKQPTSQEFTFGMRFMIPSDYIESDFYLYKSTNYNIFYNSTERKVYLEIISHRGKNSFYMVKENVISNTIYSIGFIVNNNYVKAYSKKETYKYNTNNILLPNFYLKRGNLALNINKTNKNRNGDYAEDGFYNNQNFNSDKYKAMKNIYQITDKMESEAGSDGIINVKGSVSDTFFTIKTQFTYCGGSFYWGYIGFHYTPDDIEKGTSSKVTISNIKGPFYINVLMNVMKKKIHFYKITEKVNPLTGKLEEVSRESIKI